LRWCDAVMRVKNFQGQHRDVSATSHYQRVYFCLRMSSRMCFLNVFYLYAVRCPATTISHFLPNRCKSHSHFKMRSHLSPHFSNGGIWNASAADPSTSLSPQRAANARKSQTRSPPHRSVVPAPWEWGFVRKRGFRLVPRRPSLVLVPILPPQYL